MSRDIRIAGYVGCGNMASIPVKTIAKSPVPDITTGNALKGYNDDGMGGTNPTWANPSGITRAAGDVLSIMAAFGGGVSLTGNLAPSNANIQINGNPDGFEAGDVLVVTNCVNADIFKATSVSSGGGTIITLAHASGSNTGNRVGTYGPDAFVMRMNQYSYFIGTNTAGNPSLYRVGLSGSAEELVENVRNMQFRYGLDTDADGAVDDFSSTPGNWAQVVSVTVNLLMQSPDNNISTSQVPITFNNDTFTPTGSDRRLYQVYSATIGVRNRLSAM
jgi:type IV pilus assembly protein PilW